MPTFIAKRARLVYEEAEVDAPDRAAAYELAFRCKYGNGVFTSAEPSLPQVGAWQAYDDDVEELWLEGDDVDD